jgi:hypothetical protein
MAGSTGGKIPEGVSREGQKTGSFLTGDPFASMMKD